MNTSDLHILNYLCNIKSKSKIIMEQNKYPKIALGTWSWGAGAVGGDQVFGNYLSATDLKAVYKKAMDAGLNLWDTATVYGMGASEDIVGELSKDYPREKTILSTKFTPQIENGTPSAMSDMLEASCKRLNTDYIDIYWIHNPMDVEKYTPMLIPLLKSGKVKSVGVSNHNLNEIKRAEEILSAEGFHVSAIQNHFSLLYRSSEDAGILDYCKQNGITFFAYMVLEQGALSGKYDVSHPLPEGSGRAFTYNSQLPLIEKLVDVMREIGKKHYASVAQIAIAWAIAKQTLPIIGVTKVEQVDEAVSAAQIVLSAEEMRIIESTASESGANTRGSWEKPMI